MDNIRALKEKAFAQELRATVMNESIQNQAKLISAYQTAEEREAILSAIVDFSDDAIISKDLNGIVTSWNKSAERIFGYTALEMIGKPILTLIPDDRLEEETLILSRLRSGERVDHFETKRRKKDGRIVDVSLTISPIKNVDGKITGVSKIARDITDKKLEEQRKYDFIAIVSHELKTPLTSVKSYIQLALNKAKERADKFAVNVLTRADLQTSKMTTMIHDYLNVARLEQGKMTLSLTAFSLNDLMEEVISDALILAPDHLLDYSGCPDVELYADRDKICQVMMNLLNNASKYSSTGTTIKINCSLEQGQVIFSVTDQGVGISPTDQVHLFERFYRVSNKNTMEVSGFGIGLYLVAEIIKLHGSSIKLVSEIGEGTTFSFSLPMFVR